MVALLPQVIAGFRWRAGFVTWPTSLLTGLCCCALGVCLWTLGARLTAALDAATGGLWLVLLAQRLVYGAPKQGAGCQVIGDRAGPTHIIPQHREPLTPDGCALTLKDNPEGPA